MKQWKARWFVLDTEKNLLTYYDSEENPQLQGRINLEEMRGCRPVHPLPGAPKSADSRSFIEVSSIVGDLFTEADRVHNVDLVSSLLCSFIILIKDVLLLLTLNIW